MKINHLLTACKLLLGSVLMAGMVLITQSGCNNSPAQNAQGDQGAPAKPAADKPKTPPAPAEVAKSTASPADAGKPKADAPAASKSDKPKTEPPPADKSVFAVQLDSYDRARETDILKAVRDVTGLGLKDAAAMVEGAPRIVKDNVPTADAEKIKKQLEASGGKVSLMPRAEPTSVAKDDKKKPGDDYGLETKKKIGDDYDAKKKPADDYDTKKKPGDYPGDPVGKLPVVGPGVNPGTTNPGTVTVGPGTTPVIKVVPDKPDLDVFKDNLQLFMESGGTKESEAAVQAGLRWLRDHQAADGHWSMHEFPLHGQKMAEQQTPPGRCNCGGAAVPNDVAATALALWPFIGNGETHRGSEKSKEYTKPVDYGMKWLLKQQKPDGDLRGTLRDNQYGDGNDGGMYTHGLATIVLCELYTLTGDTILQERCQKAIDFIIKAQHPAGGWRYKPNAEPGDMSVSSWQIMALKSGEMAGIIVPREVKERAGVFMQLVSLDDNDGYGYQTIGSGKKPKQFKMLGESKPDHPAVMTAAGMLCRQYLLDKKEDIKDAVKNKGMERLLANPPDDKLKNIYYYYYATQVMFNVGGDPWKKWNVPMRDHLIRTQDKGTTAGAEHQKGSWDPAGDVFERSGGRIYTTSLSLLTLEIYYRYLPLNRRDLGIDKKIDIGIK